MRLDKRKITKEAIYKTFFNFKEQINAFGMVSHLNAAICQIIYSTTSGMSGSPLLVYDCENPTFSDLKIVGLYNGGPPLPIQYGCLQVTKEAIFHRFYNIELMTKIRKIAETDYNNDSELLSSIQYLDLVLQFLLLQDTVIQI